MSRKFLLAGAFVNYLIIFTHTFRAFQIIESKNLHIYIYSFIYNIHFLKYMSILDAEKQMSTFITRMIRSLFSSIYT